MSRPFLDPSSSYFIPRKAGLTIPAACLLWTSIMSAALAQQGVQVSAQDGLLSVQANNASATEMAEMLSEQLGISVVVTGDTEARVNIDIINEPLDKALAKLSPNHMLVRKSKQADSEITEVILMMGEGGASNGSGGGEDQFLPSGSPADDVASDIEQPVEDTEQGQLNGSDEANETESSDPENLPAENFGDSPPPESFDPVTGMPIDPVTGLPQE